MFMFQIARSSLHVRKMDVNKLSHTDSKLSNHVIISVINKLSVCLEKNLMISSSTFNKDTLM